MKKPRSKAAIVKSSDELAMTLGLSRVDAELMKYKAQISAIAVRAICDSGMTINEVVEISGVARSKVSAVKNGATVSVSIDLLLKIIAATGTKIKLKVAS